MPAALFFPLPLAWRWRLAIHGDDRDARGTPNDTSIGRGALPTPRKDVI
ncbi:hypothetical protein XaFJ1_GM000119 [Xanthomonas albilineans]|nr:hypothetical protein XaFJ1_GM000119 [Xanthomonas albilineans]